MKITVSWMEGKAHGESFLVKVAEVREPKEFRGTRETEFVLRSDEGLVVSASLLKAGLFDRIFASLPLVFRLGEDEPVGIIDGPRTYRIANTKFKFSSKGISYDSGSELWASPLAEYSWHGSRLKITSAYEEHQYFFSAFGVYLLIDQYNK